MAFEKLVRFQHNGQAHFGNLVKSSTTGFTVQKLEGSIEDGFTSAVEDTVDVPTLLCPVESTPIIICVGLNYQQHANEAKLTVPKHPVIFTKPADALAGPFDTISIHPDAQGMLDYEGELTVLIGKDGKNVTEADALDYVAGYTIGNDVSARNFQLPEVSGGQFGYAKSMDGFAPIGPAIISSKLIPDPQKLRYVTRVNGEILQQTGTDDMIWSVKQLIAHLTRGTTLRKGTLIMTGTPSGVGLFRNQFLKDGDLVEVDLEGFGAVANKMSFEKTGTT